MKPYIILAVIFIPPFLGLAGYVANDWFGEYKVQLREQGAKAIMIQVIQQIENTGIVRVKTTDRTYILIEKNANPN